MGSEIKNDAPPAVTEAMRHDIYPDMTHDERARLNFLTSTYRVLSQRVAPGNKLAFEQVVEPAFKRDHGRAPSDRHEVRKSMNANSFHGLWGALRRSFMEIRQMTGQEIVLRQVDDLSKRAGAINDQHNRLHLNPDVEIPRYVGEVDHHCMPGSYYRELVDGDVSPAANYDMGLFVTTSGTIGPLNDGGGRAIASWLKSEHPAFQPKRVLDIGVAVGHSLFGLAKAFPETQFTAIDVASPMLRYAAARAHSLGLDNIEFIQASGEDLTQFEDASFDMVMTSIFLHEHSGSSLPKLLKEANRVLGDGGLMLHLEQPQYSDDMPPYEQFIRDWDAYNNNEPFWSAMHAIDLTELLSELGFHKTRIFQAGLQAEKSLEATAQKQKFEEHGRSPAWNAYGAWKDGERATNA